MIRSKGNRTVSRVRHPASYFGGFSAISLALCFVLLGVGLVSCVSNKDVGRVTSSRPKYEDARIETKKLYTIDVTRINIFSRETRRGFDNLIVFDKFKNMYILDTYESRISVFDKNGQFVRSFGGAGQGPKEFTNPWLLFVKDNEIHVLQGFGFDFKIVNLDGEFVSTELVRYENQLRYYVAGGDIYLFSGKTDPTFTTLKFIVRRFGGGRFDREEALLTFDYPPGLRGPEYDFVWPNWMLVSDNGEIYFPEDNLNKYSIVKYTREGKPSLVFGRDYEVSEYSKTASDRFNSFFRREIEAGTQKFPKTPPVVRKMFQDQKKNIWVVVGETFEDNEDPAFENRIDVFSPKGEWLYSFKSKSISRNTLYDGGRLYSVPPINLETFEQSIDVYEIKY
jgi:hypothetical protein